MNDIDVRRAVCQHLEKLHADDDEVLIVEEMGVWSGAVRIDVAVINGEMHGFELKSSRDTLERLPNQRALYDRVFDRVTLVVADRHIEKALGIIPDWWGVVTASGGAVGVDLHPWRDAGLNYHVDALQTARLLWRDEALDCLTRHGGTKGFKSATSEKLANELAGRLPLATLRDETRAALKRRPQWLGQHLSNK